MLERSCRTRLTVFTGAALLLLTACTHRAAPAWMTAQSPSAAAESDAPAERFGLANAYLCALACDAAGLTSAQSASAFAAWGFHDVQTVASPTDPAIRCTIAANTRIVLIAFPESASPESWPAFDATLVPFGPPTPDADAPRVYGGFSNAMEPLWPELLRAVTDLSTANRDGSAPRTLRITGHGFGGALATLAAFELTAVGHRVAAVYTFGQPRVGNGAFASLYASRPLPTFRVTRHNDPVPNLPPTDEPSRAARAHFGKPFLLQRDGALTESAPLEQTPDLIEAYLDARRDLLRTHSIRDGYLQPLYLAAHSVDDTTLPHPPAFDAAARRYGASK